MRKWYGNLLREINQSGDTIFLYDPQGLIRDLNFHAELSKEFLIHEYQSDGDLYQFFHQNSQKKILIYSNKVIKRDFISKNFNQLELTLKPVFTDLDLGILHQVDVSFYQDVYNYYHELKSHDKPLDTEQIILKSVWDIDLGELFSSTNNLKVALSYLIDDKNLPDSIITSVSDKLGVYLPNLLDKPDLICMWLEDIILIYISELKDHKNHKYDLSNSYIQFYLSKIDYNLGIDSDKLTDALIKKEPWLARFKKKPSENVLKHKFQSDIEQLKLMVQTLLDKEFDLNQIENILQLSRNYSKILYHIQINDWPLEDFLNLEICYKNLENLFKRLLEKDRFQLLFNYPYLNQPYTVDKILPHLMNKYKEDNIAFILMDGMSYDEWFILKSKLGGFQFKEMGVFAILPTITSFSRTSIFAGKKPIAFMKDNKIPSNIEKEEFFKLLLDNGFPEKDILYGRIDLNDNLVKTKKENISFDYLDGYKFLGLICNLFDDMSHHMVVYGDMKSNLYKNIENGIESSQLIPLISKLHDFGYKIVLASDHGNIFCKNNYIRPNKNLEFEKRKSSRCLIFDNEIFADKLIEDNPGKCFKYKYNVIGNDLTLVFASSDEFFSNKAGYSITHGSIMPEEWVVPLVVLK